MPRQQSMKRRGEDAAAAYLERVGMDVTERTWKCEHGTADIIALDEGVVVFVDVVTRSGGSKPVADADTVSNAAARKMRRIANAYREEMLGGNEPDFEPLVRWDRIVLLVIAQDRALLRHHRSIIPNEEV